MSTSGLLDLVNDGQYDTFESRCLELLDSGAAPLADLAPCFERLRAAGEGPRAATLAQMVLDNGGSEQDARAALKIAQVVLLEDNGNAELRAAVVAQYKRIYADNAALPSILEASGLAAGRAARAALRVLDMGLDLKPGDVLISRMDDRAVQVTDINAAHGLFTLRREGRVTTLPIAELAREYDPVDQDDFRALRQLDPDRLIKLLHEDPVALVVGMVHAHGESLDTEVLKHDLVPRYLDAKQWSKWWTRARTLLKRSPQVRIEGRSPMLLSYVAEGHTLEDETWERFQASGEPNKWVSVVEAYLREQSQRKEKPQADLLRRVVERITAQVETARARRPGEALAAALVLDRLADKGVPLDRMDRLSVALLRETQDPVAVIRRMQRDDTFWNLALAALEVAFPDGAADRYVELLPDAPAGAVGQLAKGAIAAGKEAGVQQQIASALAEPHEHVEIVYWLWKAPDRLEGVQLPPDGELFSRILATLAALGRTLNPPNETTRRFRDRMKSVLALRSYAKARACLAATEKAQAVTIRSQLDRLEGLGDNVPAKLLDILRDTHPALWAKPVKRLEAWEDPDVLWGTQAGLQKRTAERDHLVNVEMRENAKRIGEAAAHGDLSENSEYKFALEERDLLRARVAGIQNDLSRARMLTRHDVPDDHVGIGSRVTLRNAADGAQREMVFLGPFDADADRAIYNYLSPVGLLLMGKQVGEHVTLTLDGHETDYEIAALANALDG